MTPFQENRFNDLYLLLIDFLSKNFMQTESQIISIGNQIENVLSNCNNIKFDNFEAATAYACLHFLDRYHRFQLIFEKLNAHRIIPLQKNPIKILDIGTGPGPSMYAASDFFAEREYYPFKIDSPKKFSVDYVERSPEFRKWLHFFTEYANANNSKNIPWMIPYHNGTFDDFEGINFDTRHTYYQNDESTRPIEYKKHNRYNIMILSNFLTETSQVTHFQKEITYCMRHLKNGGIFIIAGARSTDHKYSEIYRKISNIIFSENYSNWKYIAKCSKIEIKENMMSYKWDNTNCQRLLSFVVERITNTNRTCIPEKTMNKIKKWLPPNKDRTQNWEIHVFQKKSWLRPRKKA